MSTDHNYERLPQYIKDQLAQAGVTVEDVHQQIFAGLAREMWKISTTRSKADMVTALADILAPDNSEATMLRAQFMRFAGVLHQLSGCSCEEFRRQFSPQLINLYNLGAAQLFDGAVAEAIERARVQTLIKVPTDEQGH